MQIIIHKLLIKIKNISLFIYKRLKSNIYQLNNNMNEYITAKTFVKSIFEH